MRLYPITTDERVLEKLAYVSPGTATQYRKFFADWEVAIARYPRDESLRLKRYDMINALGDIGSFEGFLVFGFGDISESLDLGHQDLHPNAYTTELGSTVNTKEVVALLKLCKYRLSLRVSIDDIGGVMWSSQPPQILTQTLHVNHQS